MSNRTSANLAWGFALPEGETIPESINPLLEYNGVRILYHDISKQDGDEQAIILIAKSWILATTRDGATRIQDSELSVQEDWRPKLAAFCEHTGIRFHEPSWVLYVHWDK